MVTFSDSDAIAAGTSADRTTLVLLALISLVGLVIQGVFALIMKRMASAPPSPPAQEPPAFDGNRVLTMLMTMQHQVGDLSQAVFEARDDILAIKTEASDMRTEFQSLRVRLVEESRWDGKTDRRRPNPPPYSGPERRKRS